MLVQSAGTSAAFHSVLSIKVNNVLLVLVTTAQGMADLADQLKNDASQDQLLLYKCRGRFTVG